MNTFFRISRCCILNLDAAHSYRLHLYSHINLLYKDQILFSIDIRDITFDRLLYRLPTHRPGTQRNFSTTPPFFKNRNFGQKSLENDAGS